MKDLLKIIPTWEHSAVCPQANAEFDAGRAVFLRADCRRITNAASAISPDSLVERRANDRSFCSRTSPQAAPFSSNHWSEELPAGHHHLTPLLHDLHTSRRE